MVRMRAAPISSRFTWAVLFALLLGLRCLAPAGFMPAFDHGVVTIVACPDAGGGTLPMMHHHLDPAHRSIAHQPCPYAAASSVGAVGPDWAPIVFAPMVFAVSLVLGRTFPFIERHLSGERPPAIGPPIPA